MLGRNVVLEHLLDDRERMLAAQLGVVRGRDRAVERIRIWRDVHLR